MACEIGFNIGDTSGLYSQLTGVLAGFSFTAVVIAISRSLESANQQDDQVKASLDEAMPMMICSFLGLVVTSLTYAAITGDADNTGRATIEELVGGLAFAIAGLLMFYSIVLLLYLAKSTESARHGRRVLGQFITLVGFAYICNGLDDYNDAHFSHGAPKWETGVIYGLLLLYAVYAVLGYLNYHRLPHFSVAHHDGGKATRKIATVGLSAVIICAIGVGFFSAYGGGRCTTPDVGVVLGLVAVTLVITLAFSVWLFLSRPEDEWHSSRQPGEGAASSADTAGTGQGAPPPA